MANLKNSVPENLEGPFFVDKTCINCDACRKFSPDNFSDNGEFSYINKQPEDMAEVESSIRALISCPVGAIGIQKNDPAQNKILEGRETLPLLLEDNIYICGYNHKKTYGAESYFIKEDEGNWLIDSPRFVRPLVKKIEDMGGLKYIFTTHIDDVGDSKKFAKHFNAKRIIHQFDSEKNQDAETILEGSKDHVFDKGRVIFTPGHTKGHHCLLYNEKFLFTGDHFAWLGSLGHFGSFRKHCWHSWEEQIDSVDKLKACSDVQWVLPGHGKRKQVSKGTFKTIIEDAVKWMKEVR